MKRSFRTFTVLPKLPQRLEALHKLAYNLWMAWHHEATALFRRIDTDLWTQTDHSPVKLLGRVPQTRLDQLADDDGFLAHLERVEEAFDAYINDKNTWFAEHHSGPVPTIAYFSAEFGIHESVPVYSGGLGVLSGDHLKSASDLGLPLVGVGLMYREGYFRQYLTVDGWQQERYPENDFFNLPLIPELNPQGLPLVVGVPMAGREVMARVWRLQVGRIPLYLLDTNIPQNSADDRSITARLYGGDHDMRIRQEMILGVGGVRALRALGKSPTVCHMNEGHSAFCGLERIREMIETTGCDFATAREAVMAGTVFTTHTPVPAGNDVFGVQLIEHYFSGLLPQLKIGREDLINMGRQHPNDQHEGFGMTVLALRLANFSNGVSQLHGNVSRAMWKTIWPECPTPEIPITSITNGVHTSSWVSPDLSHLFDRYLGNGWKERPYDPAVWKRVEHIPDAELWRTHERRRERLVSFARVRLRQQLIARGALPAEIAQAEEVLDPETLTIGFARRFATYKRGSLIFRNLDRLLALLTNKDRPVQLLYSGKAHPRDQGGKELIQEIMQFARRKDLRLRVVFLEDYDINVCRYLVQGVDVWLNNPRRPLEASGTSGMKVAANGGLNLSILDGWWVEGYDGNNGFAIGAGEEYADTAYQDEVESRTILDVIEQEIVPLFYTRGSDGVPRGWVRMMKQAIATLAPVYSTGRMVAEYATRAYFPSAERSAKLAGDGLARAAALANWRQMVRKNWSGVRVANVETEGTDPMHVGATLQIQAKIYLGSLTPQDVLVQLYYGAVDNQGEVQQPNKVEMVPDRNEAGAWLYRGDLTCKSSGQQGFAVRVMPRHPDLQYEFDPGFISWV
ncbi:MAG: glycosyltransferase family 1 protein [Planctomycetia bacterium]|nr:glycosyltransferase family 1 protein [Planctomycetia bacterium]